MSMFDNTELTVCVSAEDGKIRAGFTPPADFLPFHGHFPGNPILPGIAQISLITEILNRADSSGFVLDTVKRVKYLAPAPPEKALSVEVACRPGGEDGIQPSGPQGEQEPGKDQTADHHDHSSQQRAEQNGFQHGIASCPHPMRAGAAGCAPQFII